MDVCKTLRILNQVRDYRIGMPLTFAQYKILGPDLLIERLINRHHHYLAYQICEYLGMTTSTDGTTAAADKVLIHWACAKIKALSNQLNDNDEVSLRHFVADIVTKLSACPGISYAEISATAHKAGKPRLATMLLDHEPRAQDQVPLLLSMRQPEHALEKAIESGDSDLGMSDPQGLPREKTVQLTLISFFSNSTILPPPEQPTLSSFICVVISAETSFLLS